jgi:hypothetical protein
MRVAEEGADIISADRCQEFGTVPYPLATPEDVSVAARQGESPGRRIVTAQADVRDFDLLTSAVDADVAGLGRQAVAMSHPRCANSSTPPWNDSRSGSSLMPFRARRWLRSMITASFHSAST